MSKGAQAAETVRNDLPRGDELDLRAKEMVPSRQLNRSGPKTSKQLG